jgi:hypothetical protein
MEAAGHVGGGDDVQQRLVLAHAPGAEAFAEVCVQVDVHGGSLLVRGDAARTAACRSRQGGIVRADRLDDRPAAAWSPAAAAGRSSAGRGSGRLPLSRRARTSGAVASGWLCRNTPTDGAWTDRRFGFQGLFGQHHDIVALPPEAQRALRRSQFEQADVGARPARRRAAGRVQCGRPACQCLAAAAFTGAPRCSATMRATLSSQPRTVFRARPAPRPRWFR